MPEFFQPAFSLMNLKPGDAGMQTMNILVVNGSKGFFRRFFMAGKKGLWSSGVHSFLPLTM
jgi:hypothetical protein